MIAVVEASDLPVLRDFDPNAQTAEGFRGDSSASVLAAAFNIHYRADCQNRAPVVYHCRPVYRHQFLP